MSYPVLYVPAGDVIPLLFSSYDANGASVTLTGLAVTDIEIYKDGSVTQRASDAGYTLLDTDGIDFDATTGLHGFSIDTGDNTDAGFYTVGAWFTVVVSAVTIAAQTVTFIAAMFRLMPAESVAGKPKVDVDAWLGTAAATPTVAGVPEVDLTHIAGAAVNTASAQLGVNVIQAAGTAWNSGAITASTLAADAITAAKVAADVGTEIAAAVWNALTSGLTTVGSIGKLLVDNINATISSRSSHAAADVWSVATRLLTAGTNIVLAKGTGVTGFNDLSAANVNAEVVDALATDTYAEPSAVPAATASIKDKLGFLAALARNKITQTATTQLLRNDADSATIATSTVSDDGTTATRGEFV